MNNKLFLILITLLFVAACGQRQAVKQEEPVVTKPAEELKLPDISPAKEAKEEKKPPQEKPAAEKKQEEQYVMLNFENADIETVVATIADMLKVNYILAPGVTGKITIQSHNKIPISELFPTLQTALEFNGFTAVKDGSFYRIVQIDNAKQQPVPVQSGKKVTLTKDGSFVTQEIPLEYVKAGDVANIVRNLMPRGTDIVVYEPSNLLIVTAPPSGILKFLKLIEAIDIPSSERDSVRTYVYPVENGEAKKLAEILRNVYGKKSTTGTPATPARPQQPQQPQQPQPPQPRVPVGTQPRTQTQPASVSTTTGHEGFVGELEGELQVEAYDDINALIIKATPRGYISLLETIKKLDIQPKQVLIEVLIAEISLEDETRLGIEWLFKTDNEKYGVGILGGFTSDQTKFFNPIKDPKDDKIIGTDIAKFAPVLSSGAFLNIINPERFNVLITAAAQSGNLNVLASPHILAIDNKEAKIEIGSEVPVATSVTSAGTDATNINNTTSQVQFKQVGILLTVTPHINDKKQVTLKVSQEASEVGALYKIGGEDYTGFNTRKANTTAIVQDGHTLVIGGIIYETMQSGRSGIPFLSQIPLLGYLFGTTTDKAVKRELIIMITPHVVADKEEADGLTKEYLSRVKDVKKKIEKRQQKLKDAIEESKEEAREKEEAKANSAKKGGQ